MNVGTAVDSGVRSLPAEFRTARTKDFGGRRLWQSQAGMHGAGVGEIGDAAQDIAAAIQAASQATLPLLVATNPGTSLQYNPQTGQMNLVSQAAGYPVGGQYAQYPVGNPTGQPQAELSGSIGTGTLLLIAAVGLGALFLMKRG